MERFQILFPVQMLTWLRKEADRRGVSVGEAIRAILQNAMDKK